MPVVCWKRLGLENQTGVRLVYLVAGLRLRSADFLKLVINDLGREEYVT
jgi:hypothetical protein